MSQSLFYWITYSYNSSAAASETAILVSILILLDYLFLYMNSDIMENGSYSLNPYFIGLPILIN